jgi:hypothetical protein
MDVRRVIDYLKAELRKVDAAIESLEAAIEGSLAAEQKDLSKIVTRAIHRRRGCVQSVRVREIT